MTDIEIVNTETKRAIGGQIQVNRTVQFTINSNVRNAILKDMGIQMAVEGNAVHEYARYVALRRVNRKIGHIGGLVDVRPRTQRNGDIKVRADFREFITSQEEYEKVKESVCPICDIHFKKESSDSVKGDNGEVYCSIKCLNKVYAQ